MSGSQDIQVMDEVGFFAVILLVFNVLLMLGGRDLLSR